MTLLEIARMTESEARTYLESLRWPNGPQCPHCGCQDVTRLNGEAHRDGVIQCNSAGCRQQFTVTVKSVMESSKIPLVKWVVAFHLITSSKKGFSALQLQRELGLGSYKSAWFMLHRIRHAMAEGELTEPAMSGTVEADEAYFGGKPRHANQKADRKPAKRGRGTNKQPVVVLVERDGNARSNPVERVDAKTLHSEVLKTVRRESTLITDEWNSYRGLASHFDGGHHTVNHSQKEYCRWDENGMAIHSNTAESFFSLMKRGFVGIYHSMSKQHLHRYCAEYDFRWNHRKVSDHERMEAAIQRVSGKRLMYETPAKNA